MRRVAVRALIFDGDKMLLVRLQSSGVPFDYYCTVGGGVDPGEGLIEAVKREVMEETGVYAQVGRLLFVQQFTGKQENLEFFFHVKNTEDFKSIDLSKTSHGEDEISEIGFFDPSDIDVQPDFLKKISIQELVDSRDVRFFNNL